MTIGYLVPEFPGQTHVMFWREVAELRKRGVRVELVSTRRPQGGAVHGWTAKAVAETTYLYPPAPSLVAAGVSTVARAGRGDVASCYQTMRASALAKAGKVSPRLLGLAVSGGMLAGLARERQWTHVHVHSCGDAANIALFASTLWQLTYSITLHGGIEDYGSNQEMKWRGAAFAIVITKVLETEVQRWSLVPTGTSLRVVGMGVDPQLLRREIPYRPWRSGERARLFSCARLNEAKGHGDALAALALIRGAGVDAVLVIAGEDELGGRGYRRTLEEHIVKAGLTGAVELLGAVSEERVRRELEVAHAFVLASHAEPLGVAIMEAMAMETPVVVTGAGGVGELVEDGISGLIVPPASAEALAAAVARLLADPELAHRLGTLGRRTVVERFSSGRSAEVLIEELEKVGALRPPVHD